MVCCILLRSAKTPASSHDSKLHSSVCAALHEAQPEHGQAWSAHKGVGSACHPKAFSWMAVGLKESGSFSHSVLLKPAWFNLGAGPEISVCGCRSLDAARFTGRGL